MAALVPARNSVTELIITNSRTKKTRVEECSFRGLRGWEDLVPDILREILCRVPLHDLFLNISSVCRSWESACWDFLFWSRNVFDLSARDVGFGIIDSASMPSLCLGDSRRIPGLFGMFKLEAEYNKVDAKLVRVLRCLREPNDGFGYALRNWRLSIHTVILPKDLVISETHLVYIAERFPCVKNLVLLNASRITRRGFAEAVQNWKHLKEIYLGHFSDDPAKIEFVEELGRSRQELESLHMFPVGRSVDAVHASLIANNLLGLKKLEFFCGDIYTKGVVTLFRAFLNLEMSFYLCYLVNGRGPGLIRGAMLPNRPGSKTFTLRWGIDVEGYAIWHVETAEDQSDLRAKLYYQRLLMRTGRDESDLQAEFNYWIFCREGGVRHKLVAR